MTNRAKQDQNPSRAQLLPGGLVGTEQPSCLSSIAFIAVGVMWPLMSQQSGLKPSDNGEMSNERMAHQYRAKSSLEGKPKCQLWKCLPATDLRFCANCKPNKCSSLFRRQSKKVPLVPGSQ